jgi:hypothetical protein
MPKRKKKKDYGDGRISQNVVDLMKAAGKTAQEELVVDRKTGNIRQAGANTQNDGQFIRMFRRACEQDLYTFLDGVLNYWWLEPELHHPVCDWLTTFPPWRKMLLMPRNHGKSTIVGRGVPLHVMIQPKDTNMYFPGEPGSHMRLVMAGETEERSVDHMRVIRGALENNILLRALWPHIVWDNPKRQAGKWSDVAIIIPRDQNFPEPTIRAIGVGGAITGSHPNMLIKDDITTEKAANEPSTMHKAIEWHADSRALFEDPERNIELITATYWAAWDLPHYVEQNDPTVQVNTEWRQMVNGQEILYPWKYGYPGAVEQLQKEHPIKFPLLFMNKVVGSDLTDFDLSALREYTLHGDTIVFREDERDIALATAVNAPPPEVQDETRGMDLYTVLSAENLGYLRNTRSL